MKTTNSGSAKYEGFGKDGKGHVSTGSGALDNQPYGFNTRFEDGAKSGGGTNPEELIAAAHASCFTMALSFQLAGKGQTDGTIETSCEVTLEKQGEGFTVTKSALSVRGGGDGLDQATFEECAKTAKENCPISKLLDTEITLETEFTG